MAGGGYTLLPLHFLQQMQRPHQRGRGDSLRHKVGGKYSENKRGVPIEVPSLIGCFLHLINYDTVLVYVFS